MNPTRPNETDLKKETWHPIVDKYQDSHLLSSLWQLTNTLIPYFLLWFLMYQSLKISYLLTLSLSVLPALFLVRIFIIFHDCGHGSFFKSQKLNDILGFITGVLTFTPYQYWRHEHAKHHATAGDLDHRGVGDIWTMTVEEYEAASKGKKLAYRLARNPIVLFIIGPAFMFIFTHRFAIGDPKENGRYSVWWTNLAILGLTLLLGSLIGFKNFFLVQLPIVAISASVGVWMFYVQHQFEGVYWERHENWDYAAEALYGSSFYKLPKVLQWFTGNIGFHHIHHLSPKIPNYKLPRCHEENPIFQKIKPITLLSSMKSFTFRLWDEKRKELVGFNYKKKRKLTRTSQ